MKMKTALNPIYVQDFLFKQANTCQIFDGFDGSIPDACNLVAVDKKRGLLYIGHNNKITVLKQTEDGNNIEWKIKLELPSIISKLVINCDCSCIAIAIAQKPTVLIYDAYSLTRNSLNLLLEITCSNKPDSYVTDIRWNPSIPLMLFIVASDYTSGNFQLKIENSLPKVSVQSHKVSNELQVSCAAWSPKGKQVVVGCKNGNIVQLKPDMKVARNITGPSPPMGEIISILWISNYQFCAAYVSSSERHVNVLIIDAPKGETNATFTCYEDITYGFSDPEQEEEGGVARYYFEYISEWGFILAGSSNSSEIAVLGTTDGGANWNQWQLVDNGRAQLPLIRTTEIFPVGLAVDKSPVNKLPWGTDSTLPYPVPILHILGTSGRLCSFHMVNLMPNCPSINSPPTEIVAPVAPVSIIQPSVSSAEMSFNINAAITSTPRSTNKQQEVIPEREKTAAVAAVKNIFGDSLKAAGFFQQPGNPMEQVKRQEEKNITSITTATTTTTTTITTISTTTTTTTTTTSPISKLLMKAMIPTKDNTTPLEENTKTETELVANKEITSLQVMEQKAVLDDIIRMRACLQEQALFEKELRKKLETQVWECGTEEEKKRLGETSAIIEQFVKDLKDATNSLSSDIAYLKALLLQSFAWIEETKSKNTNNINITSTKNCGENSKIAELQRLYYYTQTQLNQVGKILDLEWSMHNTQEEEQTKMKIPSLEFIYQNMLLHSKIIVKEKEKLEQISRKWKFLNRSLLMHNAKNNYVSNLIYTMSNMHVNYASKSCKTTLSIQGNVDEITDARCKAIASKTLNFTYEKQIKLKTLLTESSPRVIKPVNPSPIQDRLEATLSSLASQSKPKTIIIAKPSSSSSTVDEQSSAVDEKSKLQNPLVSLNSIVAKIGSSCDTQNKSLLSESSVSFPAKQTDNLMIGSTAPVVLSQLKQDTQLNVGFSSMTFGTLAPKSQQVILAKSSLVDATSKNAKESINDSSTVKMPESCLFSTGLLRDALTMKTVKGDNLPSVLSATPIIKTDAAAATTFSFATPSIIVPSVAKSLSSVTTFNTMTSFTYSNSSYTPSIDSSRVVITPTSSVGQQVPTELIPSLSHLGSSNPLTPVESTGYSNNNQSMISTSFNKSSVNVATISTTAATTVSSPGSINIGEISISRVNTCNVLGSKPVETPVSVSIEKSTTTPEIKASILGTLSTQAPILAVPPSGFNNQSVTNNMVTIPSVLPTTTLPTTRTFPAFSSITSSSTFGTPTCTISATSVFSGYSTNTSNTNSLVTTTSSSTTITPLSSSSSFNKAIFGATLTNVPTSTSFGISNTCTQQVPGTISFSGISTTASSITPAFGKTLISSPVNAQIPSVVQTTGSMGNVFGKASTPSTLFGNTCVSSNPASATFSNTPVFGNNSIFGATPLSSTGNIFGGSAVFGTAAAAVSPGSIFNTEVSKSDSLFGETTNTVSAAPPFGSATRNDASTANANVFQSAITSSSSSSPVRVGEESVLGNQQSTFGQAPTFGAKPVFGSSPPPIFGGASKPIFGSGFGSPPSFESCNLGFGGSSVMQAGSTMENVMPKVFGDVTGNTTFESLASQTSGLSFGSLAQKSPEPEKTTFTAGSSFSSWR